LLKARAYTFADARRSEVFLDLIRAETGDALTMFGVVPLDPATLGLRGKDLTPPPAPLRRPPMTLHMVALASRPLGNGRDQDLGSVHDGARLKSNDDLKVHFRTNADAYVYLVWVDTRGKATLQYPTRAAGTDNRVRANVVQTAPEGDRWYYLDRETGVETLYLVASHEPLANLDALLAHAERGALPADTNVRQEMESLYADLRSRGSAGVRPGPPMDLISRGATSSKMRDTGAVHGYTQAIRRLIFHHDP
jgi:hypothetical protein